MLLKIFALIYVLYMTQPIFAQNIRVIHINDLQSTLLGAGPNLQYTPETTNDDTTIGGIARIATTIKKLKQEVDYPTVVVDGGDFTMGSLFHTISQKHAPELKLLGDVGVDTVCVGNHEFDFGADGLTNIIQASQSHIKPPQVLMGNVGFIKENEPNYYGKRLEQLLVKGIIKPYTIINKGGLKIGIMGLIGKDAWDLTIVRNQLKYLDMIETAKTIVKQLKFVEKVDLIIASTHAGSYTIKSTGQAFGDSIDLAKAVPEIDLIVDGHSHTFLPEPIMIEGTPIVQAGSHSRAVGYMDLTKTEHGYQRTHYKLIMMDDSIPGDPTITKKVEKYKNIVNKEFLAKYNLEFDQIIADFPYHLERGKVEESELGNLVTDAMLWYLNKHNIKTDIALASNGLVRDSLFQGLQSVSDIFKVLSIGQSPIDESLGYDLIRFYANAQDLKSTAEISATISKFKGKNYFMHQSGFQATSNLWRPPFYRIQEINIKNQNGELSPLSLTDQETLFPITMNYFLATKLFLIKDNSFGLLDVSLKDKNGEKITNPMETILTIKSQEGKQTTFKEWIALIEYLRSMPKNKEGIPVLIDRYKNKEGRLKEVKEFDLRNYFNHLQVPVLVMIGLILIMILVGYILLRVIRRRKNKKLR